jgi:hypothetical protein
MSRWSLTLKVLRRVQRGWGAFMTGFRDGRRRARLAKAIRKYSDALSSRGKA